VKQRLLNGLDDIALTLQHDAAIAIFEKHRPGWMPIVTQQR
jgi:3-isopropylmalate dehydratase small subunit